MRLSTLCLAGATLVLSATSSLALAPTPTNFQNVVEIEAQKAAAANTSLAPDPIYVDVGGDTIATATPIGGIPFSDTGDTGLFASNYESCVGCFDCPFTATGGRDVVYSYAPPADILVTVDICSSFYDTKVYVGDGGVGNIVACCDDECGSTPPIGWKSLIPSVQLLAGHTYYIFVDGYSSTDSGFYVLSITEVDPCDVWCPPGGLAEGEPTCHDGYVDSYNSGCQGDPVVFVNWPCNDYNHPTVTVCGTYGGFVSNGLSYRDTDWYQIVLLLPSTVTFCVDGEYSTLVGIIDASQGCAVTDFYDYAYGACATSVCLADNLMPGTWWLWIGTQGFGPSAGACGGTYVATLSGYPCMYGDPVEPATWGRIKGIYR